jgi:SH3 domain-containing protein
MKGVLFLGVVGAAIYTTLVVSHDVLQSNGSEDTLTPQVLSNPTARQLRSWGTDLPALATSQQASPPLRKAAVMPESSDSQHLGGFAGAEEKPTSLQSNATAYDPAEWVRVGLAARVHREASVSSPTIRFYQPGTALQVVSRENGWVQINDPTSREGGWVLEQYLVLTDGTAVTQTAAATPTALSEPTRAKPAPSAKKRARASRPTVRVPDDVAIAQFDTRWERRAERRRGFGLFFFGRFARAE